MSSRKIQADLLVFNAQEVVTCHVPEAPVPRIGRWMRDVGKITSAAVAARRGKIVAVGSEKEVCVCLDMLPGGVELDAAGGVVVPGLVDCHTHLVFAGWRSNEFVKKLEGASYLEILETGGGILNSVRATRKASRDELVASGLKRLDTALSLGTTTIEIKTGYGLDYDTELKMLQVIAELDRLNPVDVVPTFMGAHAVPLEFQDRPAAFLEWMAEKVLPEVARRSLAEFCDIFCENRVFPVELAAPFLEKARQLGFKIRLHADEIEPSGGAELAAEIRARSADHLLKISQNGITALSEAGVTAVLLPGTGLFLGEDPAPARRLLEAGLPVALATDFNPGSSPTLSLPLIMNLGCVQLGMTPSEALNAVTVNAAFVLDRADAIGSLVVGKTADMVILDAPTWNHLAYRFGESLVITVIKDGAVVWTKNSPVERPVSCAS